MNQPDVVKELEELRMWMERGHSEFTEDLDKICQKLDGKHLIIAEEDEVVVRLTKGEATCLLYACPYGEDFKSKAKLPGSDVCPDKCNAYNQLQQQLGEKG